MHTRLSSVGFNAGGSTGLLVVACFVCMGLSGLANADEPLALQPDPALLASEARQIDVMAKAASATVAVFGQDGGGGGSGVIITPDGYALTNFHVADPCGAYMRCGLSDGRLYDAVVVGLDPTGDVALIKLVGRDDFPTAPLGDSDTLRAGQACFAAGNPFLLATDFQPTVTAGIISGVQRYQYPAKTLLEYSDCIQTDAAINPGNSGGPLFDELGQVIGINGRISIEKRGRVNVGVGYAISINQIKKFMGYLRSGRIVDHATLGFTVSDDENGKVIVTNILETSDAYRRGLRFDDEIIELAGRPVGTANTLKNVIGTFPRGWRIPVTYRREGKQYEVLVRLAGLHSFEGLMAMLEGPKQPDPHRDPRDPKRPDKDRKPPRNQEDQPEAPLPPVKIAKKKKMPRAIREIYEQRRGYANYYFNRSHVQRIYDGVSAQFTELTTAGNAATWQIFGALKTGGSFQIALGPVSASADLPSGVWEMDGTQDLDTQLAPDGSGGMLLALHLLRDLVVTGPKRFGDVTYLGTAPLLGYPEPVDVLIAVRQAVELRVYTDTENGTLLALELFTDSRADPCELLFDVAGLLPRNAPDDEPLDGTDDAIAPTETPATNETPSPPPPVESITVRHGDDVYGVFYIESMSADATAQPE